MNIIDKLEKLETENKIPMGFISKFDNLKKAEVITALAIDMETIPSNIFVNEYRYKKIIDEYKLKITAIKFIDNTIGDNYQDYARAVKIYDSLIIVNTVI